MNILFINSARTWGGTEKWTLMAAESMAPEHRAFLAFRRELIGRRFTVPKFRLPFLNHIDPFTIPRIVQLVRKHNIDVIIPTKRKDYLIAGIVSRICGITCILRLGIVRTPSGMWFHRLMYGALADGIIVNAMKIKESLLKASYLKTQKIRVIYNGFDTSTIDRQFPEGAIRKHQGFMVTSMGILTRRKGFDFLIRGFARFIELTGSPEAKLTIIGSGPESDNLKTLATELGIADRLRMTGFLENPELLLAESHVFAMVSQNEGIANALLEGMYLGNAPISTRAGGADEVISDGINGLLVDYGNVEALAEALKSLFQSPELCQSISAKARQRLIEQFSMKRMKNEVADFCRELSKR
jgi:glycosyltransferase involved in cell wall biosynthesis